MFITCICFYFIIEAKKNSDFEKRAIVFGTIAAMCVISSIIFIPFLN